MAIWNDLCVLEEIARRIKTPEDFTAFGGVCRLPRSAAIETNFKSNRIPWLMLPPKSEPPLILNEREFLSMYRQQIKLSDERKFFSLSKAMYREINLPDTKAKRCYSSKGWLLLIDIALNCSLLHPISNILINLPRIKTHDWNGYGDWLVQLYCVHKFVLSASPSLTSDYTVLILVLGKDHKTELAYFRPGFQSWVKISDGWYYDVIYYEGKFYAINTIGGIFAIDIKSDVTVVCEQVAEIPYTGSGRGYQRLYLAEFGRKLLVLHRKTLQEDDDEADEYSWVGTYDFDVFEIDLRNGNWLESKDLGSRAVFLGYNSSISVEISEASNVLKSNCVYFTDDGVDVDEFDSPWVEGPIPPNTIGVGRDIGIYDLQDGTIEKIVMPEWSFYDQRSPHIWVEHSF